MVTRETVGLEPARVGELIDTSPSDRVRLAAMESWLEARAGDSEAVRECVARYRAASERLSPTSRDLLRTWPETLIEPATKTLSSPPGSTANVSDEGFTSPPM